MICSDIRSLAEVIQNECINERYLRDSEQIHKQCSINQSSFISSLSERKP